MGSGHNKTTQKQQQIEIQSYRLVDEITGRTTDPLPETLRNLDAETTDAHNDLTNFNEHNLNNINFYGTLLGTCRAARSRQNLTAVCNPSFFDSPIFYQESISVFNPSSQPLLKLTDDNQLTLAIPEMISNISPSLRRSRNFNKKELVTKL